MDFIYYKGGTPNFGDDLNAELWPELAPALSAPSAEGAFVGVGTIIGLPVPPAGPIHVFSSGMGNHALPIWPGRSVQWHSVRGPISAQLLGLEPAVVCTDGAVLTPLVEGFPGGALPGDKVLIIPHWETLTFPGWDEVARLTGFEVLDPRLPPKTVIRRIAAARLVVTESLHGAIFADLYGVPWVAFATAANFSVTKWVDWTMSVGRPFNVTMVPAPDARHRLKFGRRSEPFGVRSTFDAEDAVAEFHARLAHGGAAPAPTMRNRVKAAAKRFVEGSPALRSLTAFSPARTAEALLALAERPEDPTPASVTTRLQDDLAQRLRRLARAYDPVDEVHVPEAPQAEPPPRRYAAAGRRGAA